MTTPLTPEEERAMRSLPMTYGQERLFATLDQVRAERDALQADLGSVRARVELRRRLLSSDQPVAAARTW